MTMRRLGSKATAILNGSAWNEWKGMGTQSCMGHDEGRYAWLKLVHEASTLVSTSSQADGYV